MSEKEKPACVEFELEIERYLDGDLPDERITFWENHMKNCSTCALMLSERNQTMERAKELLTVDLLESEFEKMTRKAVEEEQNLLVNLFSHVKIKVFRQPLRIKLAIIGGTAIIIILLTAIPFRRQSLNKLPDTKTSSPKTQIESIDQQVQMIFGNKLERSLDELDMQLQKIQDDLHNNVSN